MTIDLRRRAAFGIGLLLAALPVAAATEQETFPPAARLIADHCLRCHSGVKPEASLSLEPTGLYRATVNAPSRTQHGLRLVDPGRPERSALYLKLLPPEEGRYRGPRMPMHGTLLTPAEVNVIREWIASFPQETWSGESSAAAGALAAPESAPTFRGSHLANLPTPDTLGSKELEFSILHRFKSSVTNAGSHNFYGLDSGAWISIGLAAGVTRDLDVGLRRTNLHQDWEGYAKLAVARQRPGGWPISATLVASAARVTAVDLVNRNRVALQAVLGRRYGERLSVLLVPTWVTRVHVYDVNDRGGTAALGVGGEWRLNSYLALTGEWIPQLAGVEAQYQSASFGVSIATSRHVFHLLVTNTTGMHTDLYAPGGDLDWSKHQFRLGFNITRTFERTRFRGDS